MDREFNPMNRPLTQIEKQIIERDVAEQRSLSGELNNRAAIAAGLFAINVALIYQVKIPNAPSLLGPLLTLLFIVGIAGVFYLLFWIGKGEKYGYAEPAAKWIEYIDSRIPELLASHFKAETAEAEVIEGYWRTLAATAQINRRANKRKSAILKSAIPLSLSLIVFVLAVDFFL